MTRLTACILGIACIAPGSSPIAQEARTLRAFLEADDGSRIEIAEVTVASDGQYTHRMAAAPFAEHFLSMRPFKCLEGPANHWCHVPYPYEIKRDLAEGVTDLEYDFLFLWKGAGEYGIDMWNGVYYLLEPRGEGFVGTLHEMDMGGLGVPPGAGDLRPIQPRHLEPSDPDSHWLPRLVIE